METNEQDIEVVEEDLETLDESTDWKAKAQEIEKKRREDGIRTRERTKAFKERIALLEKLVEKPEEKVSKPDDSVLLQKMNKLALRSAGITAEDEVELALSTAKKWGVDVEVLLDDEDFKVKLEKLQTSKANANATSGLRGGKGSSGVKNTPEYWIAKGTPPTADEVPSRADRMKIVNAMTAKQNKVFYND